MREIHRSGNERRTKQFEYTRDRRHNIDRRRLISDPDITIGRLRTIPVFRDLTMEQYHKIVRICSKVAFSKDEVIYRIDDDPDTMFILISGKLRAVLREGRELSRISPKDVIGKQGFFTDDKHQVTLYTVTNCVMIALKRSELFSILTQDKDMWVQILSNFVNELSSKLKNDNKIIQNLSNMNIMEIL